MPPPARYQAAVFDLDGVLTRTASLHAEAWKHAFDEFLVRFSARSGTPTAPFDAHTDYLRYVDGKPRLDGVRDFLASRDITLPERPQDDGDETSSVHGIGERKNALFHRLLAERGVETYPDAVEQLRRWRSAGLRTAMVTSSRNGTAVMARAGLRELFDVEIDGVLSAQLGLSGKPAPDIFLEAARRLDVPPACAIAVEDAEAGVEAAARAGFGFVVGVARAGDPQALRARGAHLVVRELTEVDIGPTSAWEARHELSRLIRRAPPALFLDYDGTLTPIVPRPEMAVLSAEMRAVLERLSRHCTVALVSGRDMDDVRERVSMPELVYAGSHGFDIIGPDGLREQHDAGAAALPALAAAEEELAQRIRTVDGAQVERKRFAIAVHFRNVPEADAPRVERIVDEVLEQQPSLRKGFGKKVFELRPDVAWDKGKAVLWLLDALDLGAGHTTPIYIGDDVTDEDAFVALEESDRGIGIIVAPEAPTAARWWLQDVQDVGRFLTWIADELERR